MESAWFSLKTLILCQEIENPQMFCVFLWKFKPFLFFIIIFFFLMIDSGETEIWRTSFGDFIFTDTFML